MMPRILLLAGEYPPVVGGVGTFAANVARGLRLAGARVRTVTSVPANGFHDDESLRIFTMLNHKFIKLGSLFAGGTVAVVRDRPDVILAAAWPHEGFTAYSLSETFGIPYAVMVHGTDIVQPRTRSPRGRAMTKILSSSSLLVANSNYTKNLLVKMGLGAHTIVVNPPIDTNAVCAGENVAAIDERYALHGKRVLLTTSRLFPRKGHAEVLRSLGKLHTRYPDLVYVATGEGSYRKMLERIAAASGVSDRVRFTGFVDARTLASLYDRCEIYVSPGVDDGGDVEGFGISFVEAGAHGKPVIAGNVGGVVDAVVHEETGLLIDGGEGEFERSLLRLLDDAELRARLGENGRTRSRTTFGLERQGNILMRGLEAAMASRA
jgi:phosphatidyl-myo-inositol dimannoside synthase